MFRYSVLCDCQIPRRSGVTPSERRGGENVYIEKLGANCVLILSRIFVFFKIAKSILKRHRVECGRSAYIGNRILFRDTENEKESSVATMGTISLEIQD